MSTQTMTLEQIRISGLAALMHALGPVGTIRFLQQFETGYGDYSKDRHQWLDRWDMETLLEQVKQQQKPGEVR